MRTLTQRSDSYSNASILSDIMGTVFPLQGQKPYRKHYRIGNPIGQCEHTISFFLPGPSEKAKNILKGISQN